MTLEKAYEKMEQSVTKSQITRNILIPFHFDLDTSRVLSRIFFMIQAEERHLPGLHSEIHTDTSKDKSISSLLKECTQVNTSTAVPRVGLHTINLFYLFLIKFN